jgi:hypothetical protein
MRRDQNQPTFPAQEREVTASKVLTFDVHGKDDLRKALRHLLLNPCAPLELDIVPLVVRDLVRALREKTAATTELDKGRLEDVAHLVVHASCRLPSQHSAQPTDNKQSLFNALLQSLPKTVIKSRVCMSQISDRGRKSGDCVGTSSGPRGMAPVRGKTPTNVRRGPCRGTTDAVAPQADKTLAAQSNSRGASWRGGAVSESHWAGRTRGGPPAPASRAL